MGSCSSKLSGKNIKEKREDGAGDAPASSLSVTKKTSLNKSSGAGVAAATETAKKLSTDEKLSALNETINKNTAVITDPNEITSVAAVASASVPASIDLTTKRKQKIIILIGAPGSGKDTQCNLVLTKFNLKLLICSELLKNYVKKHKKSATADDITEEKDKEKELEKEEEKELKEQQDDSAEKEQQEIVKIIENTFNTGSLVPDDITSKIFLGELNSLLNDEESTVDGVLINGYPRTETQAQLFKQNNIHVDLLINIDVNKDNLWMRISNRLVDPETNISYDSTIIELIKKKLNGENLSEEELNMISQNENYNNVDENIINRLNKRKDDEQDVFDKRFGLYKHSEEIITSMFQDACKTVDGNKPINDVFNDIVSLIEELMSSK